MEDGIYFGLPQEDYHALARFSGSGAQNMLISPATFWADSWLNPNREEREEGEDKPKHLIVGEAYHKARLEPDLFVQIYRRGINMADYPDALTTHDQIKGELEKLGEPRSVTGEKVLEAARRLRAAGYPGPIKHLILEEFEATLEEWNIVLPWQTFDQIEADMLAMHDNHKLRPFLDDGESEVSVLWTDDAGVQWKARIDRLQVNRIVDLKTFDNTRGANLEECLYNAIRYNRLYIQAYVYWTACELIRASKLRICKVQTQDQKDLIKAIRESQDPFEYWWLFQEKNGIPNVLARQLRMTEEVHPHYLAQAPTPETRKALEKKLRKPSKIWDRARLEVKHARDLFLQCREIWPDGQPWAAMVPVGEIDDEGFNRFWLDNF